MKTKNYRAATMREALEKVKQELGEEALVLDSKRVRAGGFLGLGATEMIEVRVASDDAQVEPRGRRETKASQPLVTGLTGLNLSDDSPAKPAFTAEFSEAKANSTFAALAARTYTNKAATVPAPTTGRDRDEAKPFVGVEVATTAPRIVHRRNTPPVANTSSASSDIATAAQNSRSGNEFERLRAELREVKFALNAISSHALAAGSIHSGQDSIDASEEIYDSPYYEAYLELAATGLDPALARRVINLAVSPNRKSTEQPCDVARKALKSALPSLVQFEDDPLLAANHSVLALIGPTGVGKTTTLAKLAARVALRERRRVELITLDTYRIAAVEQLKTYAEIIGAGFHVPRSILELDSIVRRLSGEATIFIDTIGRSPNDLADQMELADYLRANDDMLKCLVLQASTHPSDAQVAARKFALFGANRLAITKMDETSRPGAAVTIASGSTLPLTYLCSGQRVPEDIESATPESLTARIVRSTSIATTA